jgi:16S rRNA (uracil1498-N3)-methyltransferase
LAADAIPALLYLPSLPGPGESQVLPPPEAHYVARVCRARIGERLEATDGRGGLATLRVASLRGEVLVEVIAWTEQADPRRAWVLCGAPEGARGDWLVEKLAELGIERFQPVDCARGAWRKAAGRQARWERLAIAALRQARRVRLMRVEPVAPLPEVLARLPEGSARWLADAGGASLPSGVMDSTELSIGFIGPSGGLEGEERGQLLAVGMKPVRLSAGRLRTETAALAWGAWWSGRAP